MPSIKKYTYTPEPFEVLEWGGTDESFAAIERFLNGTGVAPVDV